MLHAKNPGRAPLAPLVLLGSLVLSSPATAEDDQRITMPSTVVEGTRGTDRTQGNDDARREIERTPGGVAIVDAEAIGDTRAANLSDALDFVPGVMIRSRLGAGDESQLSVRGSGLRNNFHLRGINILIDGFPYGNADGFSDFESLELLNTKRIEVYKGANALRFGAGSLGGAINLVTRTGYDVAPLELRSEGGSFGFQKHHVATGGVHGPFDTFAAFTDTELDGFREHSEQVRRRFYGTLGYAAEHGTHVRLDLNYVENGETLPGGLTRQELDGDRRKASPEFVTSNSQRDYDYLRGALTVRTPLADDQSIETAVHANYQDLDHPLSFAILTGVTYNWGVEGRYIFSAPLFDRANRLTAGVQYAGTRQGNIRFENAGNAVRGAKTLDRTDEATNVGLYVEEQHDLTDRILVLVGGRFGYADRSTDNNRSGPMESPGDTTDFKSFSPKLGFVARAAERVQVYGNASHAYEPPLLLELTSPATLGGTLDELEAQKSWQFEIGARGNLDTRAEFDVSIFDIELWDELRNVNVTPFPGAPFTIPRFVNIDRSRHTGVEVGADVVGGADVVALGDTLRLRTAYTWSRFRFVDDREFGGNQLPGAPEHFVRSELRYDHPTHFWIAPGTEAVPAGYAVNSANTAGTDRYALFGLRAGYDFAPLGITLFFEAKNLLDATYASSVQVDHGNDRFFEPGDGRSFYGGVSWKWL